MYYGLTNYYQNHRRYVKSRDDFQLLGKLSKTPSSDCAPYDYNDNKPIAPCGAIANSLFSGKFVLLFCFLLLLRLEHTCSFTVYHIPMLNNNINFVEFE